MGVRWSAYTCPSRGSGLCGGPDGYLGIDAALGSLKRFTSTAC